MKFIQKVSWRAIFFINNNKTTTEDDKQGFSYGLKSGRSPPQVKDLIQFDDDLVKLVKDLKFRKIKYDFQKMLCEDTKKVQTSKQPVYKQLALGIIFSRQQYQIRDIPNMLSEFSTVFY